MGVMELRKRPGLVNNVIDIFNKCQETDVDKNRGSVLENHGVWSGESFTRKSALHGNKFTTQKIEDLYIAKREYRLES